MQNTKLSGTLVVSLLVLLGIGTYIGNPDSYFIRTVVSNANDYKVKITEKNTRNNYIHIVSCADPSDDLCADGYADTNRSKILRQSFFI